MSGKNTDYYRRIALGFITAGIILSLFIVVGLFINNDFSGKYINWELGSKIGDLMSGMIGSLFSLAGVLLIYSTLTLQSRDIKVQQQLFTIQQHQARIYSMINLHASIKDQIRLNPTQSFINYKNPPNITTDIKGEEFLKFIKNQFSDWYSSFNNKLPTFKSQNVLGFIGRNDTEEIVNTPQISNTMERIKYKYAVFFQHYQPSLREYFQYLAQLFNAIQNFEFYLLSCEEVHRKEVEHCITLLSMQLSQTELFHIFYAIPAFDNLNAPIRHYNILNRLDHSQLINPAHATILI